MKNIKEERKRKFRRNYKDSHISKLGKKSNIINNLCSKVKIHPSRKNLTELIGLVSKAIWIFPFISIDFNLINISISFDEVIEMLKLTAIIFTWISKILAFILNLLQ
ncbi:MAG: hypothetical protein HAW59_07075 [Betaproteobacteria bacterium]|nr:hypothetical protein [Betaproteobacteria bacterium]